MEGVYTEIYVIDLNKAYFSTSRAWPPSKKQCMMALKPLRERVEGGKVHSFNLINEKP
jgi:hypothetical protein